MRAIVERKQLALPLGRYVAVPGDPTLGGAASFDENAQARINTFDQAVLVPTLPLALEQRTRGPITAIAIAADSPIAACDLWLGDATIINRVRIGVGRPFIGNIENIDVAQVTLPRALPDPWENPDGGDTSQQWLTKNYVHDVNIGTTQSPISPLNDRAEFTLPLRLEIYRGDIGSIMLSQIRRAPYPSDMFFSLTGVGLNYCRMWQMTDGRDSIEVVISNQGTKNIKATIAGHDPTLKTKGGVNSNNIVIRDRCEFITDVVVVPASAGGVSGVFKRTYTEPMSWYSVRIEPNTAADAIKGAVAMLSRDA